jgi:uncharacterized protein (TIGR00255 family)
LLLSMTGFGEAHYQADALAVAVEVRTINNRYFKFSMRSGEGYTALESQVESAIREQIKRGTVQVNLRVDRQSLAEDYSVNAAVLEGYRQQIQAIQARWGVKREIPVESLLPLPGTVNEKHSDPTTAEADWPLIQQTLKAALANLDKMRRQEGQAMAADLTANCLLIGEAVKFIAARAPVVLEAYRSRLAERVRKALEEHELELNPSDIVREVAIYAERSDISEEIVRLESHLQQFDKIMKSEDGVGRKLEFLTQELHREVNTIGSKSSDVEIARHVIEVKAAIERLREMIQNVE